VVAQAIETWRERRAGARVGCEPQLIARCARTLAAVRGVGSTHMIGLVKATQQQIEAAVVLALAVDVAAIRAGRVGANKVVADENPCGKVRVRGE
jgi:hypothetical protein